MDIERDIKRLAEEAGFPTSCERGIISVRLDDAKIVQVHDDDFDCRHYTLTADGVTHIALPYDECVEKFRHAIGLC